MTPLEITITNDLKAQVIIDRKQIEIVEGALNNENIIVEVHITMQGLESVLCLDAKKLFETEVIFSGGVNYEYHYGEGDYHNSQTTFTNAQTVIAYNIPKRASVTIIDENNIQVIGKVTYYNNENNTYNIQIEFNQPVSGTILLN